MPGIGLIKRRLEKEEQAVALATSHILKNYNIKDYKAKNITVLETKYHNESGDWYVALGWEQQKQQPNTPSNSNNKNSSEQRAVVQMDSILGTVTDVKEI